MILRRLFHVHAALAEFDLALKALDSYIEIVVNAKSRAEKAAESGELEDDGTLLETLSEGVTMLCCFGSYDEAEKSKEFIELLKEYTSKHLQIGAGGGENGLLITQDSSQSGPDTVSPSVIATAYRAIGIGLANWASWTPWNESRDDIRADAIEYLERSLAPELEDGLNLSSLYTVALLLAETRDLDGAIGYVKLGLTSNTHNTTAKTILSKERDLVPLWHLLALLLSAKHDFEVAERSCEVAFEQFPNPITSMVNQRHLAKITNNEKAEGSAELTHALAEQLRGREKERIIETRITQLALVELLEGPESAVNHSDQLLSLFAVLFPALELDDGERKGTQPQQLAPPRSPTGTTRSFRSSIFGRNRTSRASDRRVESGGANSVASPPLPNEKAYANSAEAPTIEVTDGDKQLPIEHGHDAHHKLQKRGGSLRRSGSAHGPLTNGGAETGDGAASPDMVGIAVSDAPPPVPTTQPQSAKQPLRPIAHNMKPSREPFPAGHTKQPPEQDIRLPSSYRFDSPTKAVTRFPHSQSEKHALCILVKIWLLIAGLYRRASLFDDAHEACEEAAKHVARIEALVAAKEPSAKAFRARDYGSGKSCDELWADLCAERGLLSKARSRPHDAIDYFEAALMRFADHPKATIGLSNLLLDIWDQKIPAERPSEGLDTGMSKLSLLSESLNQTKNPSKPRSGSAGAANALPEQPDNPRPASLSSDEETKHLYRLSARDRAYGLLSTLTKRGSSWDNSDAWYALSRAYEAGDQIEKLREVLWWCVELEDRRPIRHWSNISCGLYVL